MSVSQRVHRKESRLLVSRRGDSETASRCAEQAPCLGLGRRSARCCSASPALLLSQASRLAPREVLGAVRWPPWLGPPRPRLPGNPPFPGPRAESRSVPQALARPGRMFAGVTKAGLSFGEATCGRT